MSSNKNLRASNRTLSREINGLKSNISSITAWICTLGVDAQLNRKYCNQDCLALYQAGIEKNGIYNVTMGGTKTIEVYCDQTTDGGGWTVIQRRVDGSTDFYRSWNEYKQGFGDNENEFYFGNDNTNILSVQGGTKGSEIRIDMKDFEGNSTYAKYSSFKVDDESAKYTLHVTGYTGNAGDFLEFHNWQQFSTYDQDNDSNRGSCANEFRGAWWYNGCIHSHLNGEYLTSQPRSRYHRGIIWGHNLLKFVEMKVRRNV